jgi:hypothetical protein
VAWYGGVTALLLAVQHLSNRVLREPGYTLTRWRGLHYYLDGWSQFDGPEYEKIARLGYSYTPGRPSNIVWFPLYPNLLRWAERLIGDYTLAGIAVSALAGLGAVVVYWRWLEQRELRGRPLLLAFAVLALYPYGWYLYGVVHSDSLFLLLAVSAFLLVERRHLVAAGVVAALATATRPTGMALIPAIIAFGLERDGVLTVPEGATGLVARLRLPVRFDRRRLRAATLGPVLSVVGLATWMAYLGVRFGDPLAFRTNQRTYHPEDLPILKRAFFSRWLHFGHDPTYALTIAGQALVLVLVVLSIPAVCRRFGFSYGLYLAVLAAIPTVSTGDFMGTGRYLMAAFPTYALAGERLARSSRRLQVAHGVVAGAVLVLMAAAFSRSWYLT